MINRPSDSMKLDSAYEYFNRTESTKKYEDIIQKSRPESQDSLHRHPRMPVTERAKIFAPFSALKGYDTEIAGRQARLSLIPRPILSEERQEELSDKLRQLQKGMAVEIACFQEDTAHRPFGVYAVLEGRVAGVDTFQRTITVDNKRIRLDDLLDIAIRGDNL